MSYWRYGAKPVSVAPVSLCASESESVPSATSTQELGQLLVVDALERSWKCASLSVTLFCRFHVRSMRPGMACVTARRFAGAGMASGVAVIAVATDAPAVLSQWKRSSKL